MTVWKTLALISIWISPVFIIMVIGILKTDKAEISIYIVFAYIIAMCIVSNKVIDKE